MQAKGCFGSNLPVQGWDGKVQNRRIPVVRAQLGLHIGPAPRQRLSFPRCLPTPSGWARSRPSRRSGAQAPRRLGFLRCGRDRQRRKRTLRRAGGSTIKDLWLRCRLIFGSARETIDLGPPRFASCLPRCKHPADDMASCDPGDGACAGCRRRRAGFGARADYGQGAAVRFLPWPERRSRPSGG
jgi:hypothetical protein